MNHELSVQQIQYILKLLLFMSLGRHARGRYHSHILHTNLTSLFYTSPSDLSARKFSRVISLQDANSHSLFRFPSVRIPG